MAVVKLEIQMHVNTNEFEVVPEDTLADIHRKAQETMKEWQFFVSKHGDANDIEPVTFFQAILSEIIIRT